MLKDNEAGKEVEVEKTEMLRVFFFAFNNRFIFRNYVFLNFLLSGLFPYVVLFGFYQ